MSQLYFANNKRSNTPVASWMLEDLRAMTSDPLRVATDFLTELARGSFEPGPCFRDWPDGGPLTLGHDWDNRFLSLSDVEVDNRVVQAVQSRMARYARLSTPRLAVCELGTDSAWRQMGRHKSLVSFGILCNNEQDGIVRLKQGDDRVWGHFGGWRIWELTP